MAIKDEFKITRQGKEFVLYAGLLGEAYPKLESIETEEILVEYDGDSPIRARHKATVIYDGKRFTGHGDADTKNVGRNIAPHLIRMSETRAKARALRDAINVGIAAFEELGDDEEPAKPQARQSQPRSGGKGGSGGGGGQKQKKEPDEDQANPPDEEASILVSQMARIQNLVGQLVSSDDPADTEKALTTLEEEIGHPLESWSQEEARHQIGRLEKAIDNRKSKA